MPKEKPRPRVITRKLLRSRGACLHALREFHEQFPKGAKVNLENAVYLAKSDDADWFLNEIGDLFGIRDKLLDNREDAECWLAEQTVSRKKLSRQTRARLLRKSYLIEAEGFLKIWNRWLQKPCRKRSK